MIKNQQIPSSNGDVQDCCAKCGLYKNCYSPHIPMETGSEHRPRVLIIGEAPGKAEDTLGQVFIGQSGELLRDAIDKYFPKDMKVWITNAVKCRPENNVIKGVTPIKCCYNYTLEDIQIADPDIIICCGSTPFKQLGGSKPITSARGMVFDMEICGRVRKVIPVFHPAYVLRNIGRLDIWEQDFKHIVEVFYGKEMKLPKYTLCSLEEFYSIVKKVGWCSFDIETNRELDFTKEDSFITCMSFHTYYNGGNYCVTIRLPKIENLPKVLTELFSNPEITLIGHNIKFDLSWVQNKLGLVSRNKLFDTQIAYSALVDEENCNSLKSLAHIYTDFGGYEQKMVDYDKDIPLGYSFNYYNTFLSDEYKNTLEEYNIYDCIATSQIYLKMSELAREDIDLYKLLYGVFFKLPVIISDIENNGIKIDTPLLEYFTKEVEDRIKRYTQLFINELIALGFDEEYANSINIASHKQITELFYSHLKLPVVSKTSSGAPSTNEEAIVILLNKHIKPEHKFFPLLKYFASVKALNTINNLFLKKFNSDIKEGYLYPRYSIVKVDREEYKKVEAGGTVTSRLSSANPNLQQIPNKFKGDGSGSIDDIKAGALEGINLQNLVVSRFEGGKILLADFSQIELRIATILSMDESMLKAYQDDVDLHTLTASQVFNIPIDEVDSAKRTMAKTVNFGILYGQSAIAFAKSWGVSEQEASDFINKFFAVRPKLKEFIENTYKEVKENGYVVDLFGKKRRLGNVWSEDEGVVSGALRQAVNFKCQASASVLTLISLIRIYNRLINKNLKSKIIGTVHDSILLDCCGDEIDVVNKIVEESMTDWRKLNFPIPIKVEIKYASNWGDAK